MSPKKKTETKLRTRLSRLELHQWALLDEAVLEPGPHFTVLTGETGAGKSLLLGAVEAISGARLSKDLVRQGCQKARVEALFSDPQSAVGELWAEVAGEEEGEDWILSRELLATGKSYCRLNGRLLPASQLKQLGEQLISLHGQRDSQRIFEIREHGRLLLRYCLLNEPKSYETYRSALDAYREAGRQLKELGMSEEERLRLLDLLTYQTEEITRFNPHKGEEDELRSRKQRLESLSRVQEALQTAGLALDGGAEAGAIELLGQAQRALEELTPLLEKAGAAAEQLSAAREQAMDISARVARLQSHVELSPQELEDVEQRLDRWSRLKKKYGGTEEKVLLYWTKAQEKLEELQQLESRLAKARAQFEAAEKELRVRGEAFQKDLVVAGERLAKEINRELAELAMKSASFSLVFREKPIAEADAEGLYRVEFLLEPNAGEGAKPLAQIASGGEAARILLAIKVVLARVDETPVLIFDEIDSGVSGETAARVGEKLVTLSREAQVICVTHSAYIASMADTHYLIAKETTEGRTHTHLTPLSPDEAREEIARLLAGDTDRETATQLALSLQQKATAFKQKLEAGA